MQKKHTPARMARLVAQWRTSGEAGASFARHHHIPPWTFWYWCRKLAKEAGATTTFVPVHVAAASEVAAIEVVFTTGERLQVRAGASPDLLRAALTALRSPC
jgi:transposase-like protein